MLARKIAFNTLISAIARIVGTVLALVTVGMLTRYFSKSQWGEYSIVLTFGGIFAVLAEWGLYQLMVREISKEGADEEKIASNLFTMRLLISLFIFALAPVVGLAFPYSAEARQAILIGMIGYWFLSGSQVLMGVFQKHLRTDKVALADLVGRVVQVGLVFAFIKLHYGLLWIVATVALSSFVNLLIVYWYARGHVKIRLAFDFGFWKKSLAQSFPLAISGILIMIYFSTDSLFLSVFRSPAEVGLYRLSYKILESLIFFPAMFVGLVMPTLSASASVDWPRFKVAFQRAHDVLLIFAVPLVAGTFMLSGGVIRLLGGSQYDEAAPILNILIVAVGVIFLSTLFSYVLIALGRQKKLLWISLIGAFFNVAFNLIFIPRYSYWAAAASTLITEALVAILMMIAIWQAIKYLPSFKIGLAASLSGFIMVAVLWFFRAADFFILLPLAAVIYVSVMFLTGGLSVKEAKNLIKVSPQ